MWLLWIALYSRCGLIFEDKNSRLFSFGAWGAPLKRLDSELRTKLPGASAWSQHEQSISNLADNIHGPCSKKIRFVGWVSCVIEGPKRNTNNTTSTWLAASRLTHKVWRMMSFVLNFLKLRKIRSSFWEWWASSKFCEGLVAYTTLQSLLY